MTWSSILGWIFSVCLMGVFINILSTLLAPFVKDWFAARFASFAGRRHTELSRERAEVIRLSQSSDALQRWFFDYLFSALRLAFIASGQVFTFLSVLLFLRHWGILLSYGGEDLIPSLLGGLFLGLGGAWFVGFARLARGHRILYAVMRGDRYLAEVDQKLARFAERAQSIPRGMGP